jgi:hypothetical protein
MLEIVNWEMFQQHSFVVYYHEYRKIGALRFDNLYVSKEQDAGKSRMQ